MFLLEIKLIYTILDASCLIGISTNLRKQQSDDKDIRQLNGYIVVEFFTLWIIAFFYILTEFHYIYVIDVKGKQELVYGHRRHSAGTILIVDQNS